jgi:TnpA family transposase
VHDPGQALRPRLRDLPDQALYRPGKAGDYGPLNPLLRQSVRTELIARHWDDLNRLAASLKDGLATPSLIVSRLQAMQRQNPLQQALQELGRVAKTRHSSATSTTNACVGGC